jgi:monofunctional biosynthetic peptidoglycan transglycosylase
MPRFAPLLVFLLASATVAQPSSPVPLPFDFTDPDVADRWTAVNDGVMGGNSEGGPAFTGETLVFSGVTDTDGGGFSSIRTRPADYDLGDADGLAVRYRADGRQYEVEVHTGERAGGIPVTYRAPLPVVEGEDWHEARVPFSSFRASAQGRSLPERRLDPARARAVGLFIYDGKSGPFRLEVDRMAAYADGS